MHSTFTALAMSTPTMVLSYAAAFFFIAVAIAAVYALVKAGKTLERVDAVLADVDNEGIPLMRKAGTTLDGVNVNLGNVDQITKDVAGITDKIDSMANVVEGAVSTPARKAAAFSAGFQGAVSSFMRRDKSAASAAGSAQKGSAGEWSYAAPASSESAAAGASSDAGVATEAGGATVDTSPASTVAEG